jgi:putative protease
MNNRTPEKILFLEKVGFRQVVLARELSLEQVRRIREKTAVPLEFFVHGALCVSYSGQCYMSEIMAERSANRGECAQFCRHCYTLKDPGGKIVAKDRYLLSLKDLDLSSHLEKLIEAGICSFKIEGRLKDVNYVKNVTAFYRNVLDSILEKNAALGRSSSGSCEFGFIPDTARSFNRGQTRYFLFGGKRRPGAIKSPKSRGRFVGTVHRTGKRYFVLDEREPVHNGDGLCYFTTSGMLAGIKVNRVEGNKIYPNTCPDISVGTKVYRNFDRHFSKELARSQRCRTIAADLFLRETDSGISLEIIDEDGIRSITEDSLEKERARRPAAVKRLAEKQLRKTGETIFTVKTVTVAFESLFHLPASVLNRLRREGFARHLSARKKQYRHEKHVIVPNSFPWTADELTYLDNITNTKAIAFYARHGVKKRLPLSRYRPCSGDDLMRTRYCIRTQLGICPGPYRVTQGDAESLILIDNVGEYQVDFNCEDCEMVVRLRPV